MVDVKLVDVGFKPRSRSSPRVDACFDDSESRRFEPFVSADCFDRGLPAASFERPVKRFHISLSSTVDRWPAARYGLQEARCARWESTDGRDGDSPGRCYGWTDMYTPREIRSTLDKLCTAYERIVTSTTRRVRPPQTQSAAASFLRVAAWSVQLSFREAGAPRRPGRQMFSSDAPAARASSTYHTGGRSSVRDQCTTTPNR